MVKDLGERAERIRKEKIDPKIDNLLKITSEGRKLALDQRLNENISKLTNDIKTVNTNNVTTDNFKMEIQGKTYAKRTDAGDEILNEVKKLGNSNDAVHIGKFMGMDMELERHFSNYEITFKGEMNHTVNLESVENNLKIALEEVNKPFAKEEEYTTKSARLSELTKELESEEKTGGIKKSEDIDLDIEDKSYSLKGLSDIKNKLKESSNQDEQEQGQLSEDDVGKKLVGCEEL